MLTYFNYIILMNQDLSPLPKFWKKRLPQPPTILVVLRSSLCWSCTSFPSPSILANQSNTISRTIVGTALPRDPRWWTLRTNTVGDVEIDNNKIVAPKYWAAEAE